MHSTDGQHRLANETNMLGHFMEVVLYYMVGINIVLIECNI